MIDWSTAERVAGFVAGIPPTAPRFKADLPSLAADSATRVVDYTGLQPAAALPEPEWVDRRAWISTNLQTMRPLLDPVAERVGEGLGTLSRPVQSGTGMLLALQVGGLTGFVSQRVLGQYELSLLEPKAPTRLLFVAPNLHEAAAKLDVDREQLLVWVTLHEVTHAVQFAGVPWLREHLAGAVRELLAGLEVSVDGSRLLRLPDASDLRALVAAVRQGELVTLLLGAERRELVDRMQATMAVVEGHAEHVMDAVGQELLPSLGRLRRALDERREERSTPLRLLERLLGLELKLRQYTLGKSFCDAIVKSGGPAALHAVWASPEALPTIAELEDPAAWLRRTNVPIVTN